MSRFVSTSFRPSLLIVVFALVGGTLLYLRVVREEPCYSSHAELTLPVEFFRVVDPALGEYLEVAEPDEDRIFQEQLTLLGSTGVMEATARTHGERQVVAKGPGGSEDDDWLVRLERTLGIPPSVREGTSGKQRLVQAMRDFEGRTAIDVDLDARRVRLTVRGSTPEECEQWLKAWIDSYQLRHEELRTRLAEGELVRRLQFLESLREKKLASSGKKASETVPAVVEYLEERTRDLMSRIDYLETRLHFVDEEKPLPVGLEPIVVESSVDETSLSDAENLSREDIETALTYLRERLEETKRRLLATQRARGQWRTAREVAEEIRLCERAIGFMHSGSRFEPGRLVLLGAVYADPVPVNRLKVLKIVYGMLGGAFLGLIACMLVRRFRSWGTG